MRALVLSMLVAGCAAGMRDTDVPPDGRASGGSGGAVGNPDASGLRDASGPPADAPGACSPQPIANITPHQWYWVPVAGSACGNGTPAGFAINASATSKEVLIYLMGGGGCYSAGTCGGAQPTAANLDGYNANKAGQELSFFQAGSIFDRNSASNPLRDATYVFVPYCTGDFHSGNTIAAYGTHHVGYSNISAYLAELVPAYCDASRIVLAGSSAGGFGALFNYEHIQQAFPQTPIDLVDDSGPPLRNLGLESQLRSTWGQVANAPAGCSGCTSAWNAYLPFLTATHPSARFSLISSLQDYSIGQFFGFNPTTYQASVNDLADNVIALLPNMKVFYIASNDHVWLNRNLTSITTGPTSLAAFIQRQLDHNAQFGSVRP